MLMQTKEACFYFSLATGDLFCRNYYKNFPPCASSPSPRRITGKLSGKLPPLLAAAQCTSRVRSSSRVEQGNNSEIEVSPPVLVLPSRSSLGPAGGPRHRRHYLHHDFQLGKFRKFGPSN